MSIADHPREYGSWSAMRTRCNNPRAKDYPRYGGRGIAICTRWDSFTNFYADMGDRPVGYTLERKNNSRGYTPSNCVWATPKAQALNKRNTRYITYKGERLCLEDWAKRCGVSRSAMYKRLNVSGWSNSRVVTKENRYVHR